MKVLDGNPRKLHFRLTLKFAPFLILVSAMIYWTFSNKFEDEVEEEFLLKSKAISYYFEQLPPPFSEWTSEQRENVRVLIYMNEAAYIILEDINGTFIDAVNLRYAEKKAYLLVNNLDDVSLDKSIYKAVIPIIIDNIMVGRVYVGFNSLDLEIARTIQSKYSLAS
jgi:hypothetical protein